MKRFVLVVAALVCCVSWAESNPDPVRNQVDQFRWLYQQHFNQELSAAFVDAGTVWANSLVATTLTVTSTTTHTGVTTFSAIDAGVVKADVLDAGYGLINGQLQVLGPIVGTSTLAGTTIAANSNGSALGFTAMGGVDAGSVRVAGIYVPIATSDDGGIGRGQRIQHGYGILSSNDYTATFNPAFSTIPSCSCGAVNATAAACGLKAIPSVSAAVFRGANASDAIYWQCTGDK